MREKKWRFWVDRGGTFTDIIGVSPSGDVHTAKSPSESGGELSALRAIRQMLHLPDGARLPADRVAEIRLGATIVTNALLQRRGDKTGLVTTRGFKDAPFIGDQRRPRLFDLDIPPPRPLCAAVAEVDERLDAAGRVIRPLNKTQARAALLSLKKRGCQAVAVSFMHAYLNPAHERAVVALAQKMGFATARGGAEVLRLINHNDRTYTALAEAYLAREMARFSSRLLDAVEAGVRVLMMQSDGNLQEAARCAARDLALSGPAGGAAAAAASGRRVIGFDMGGTSTDVSLHRGAVERGFENEINGARLCAPALKIHTIAAGGGSLLKIRDGRFLVGPDSAGAHPGPACYGRGGPAALTDCNAVMGRIRAEHFPRVFGRDRKQPLSPQKSEAALRALMKKHRVRGSARDAAQRFAAVAVESMAAAIRKVSVARGFDARDHRLNAFGGAAGQHACEVADALGVREALTHRYAGLLSAWGIGAAAEGAARRRTAEISLGAQKPRAGKPAARAQSVRELKKLADSLIKECRAALQLKNSGRDSRGAVKTEARVYCRYKGAEGALPLPLPAASTKTAAGLRAAFACAHRQRFGFAQPPQEIIAAQVEAEARIISPPPAMQKIKARGTLAEARAGAHSVRFGHRDLKTPFYDWQKLPANKIIRAPAVVFGAHNTVVVSPGWTARQNVDGNLILRRESRARAAVRHTAARPDPALLEVFNHRFMAIAEQMGEALRQAATSVNIRERLDFSCALFDGEGRLAANAPHIPVHLGAMGDSVRALIENNPAGLMDEDVYMLNSPYCGGTHLPDITVIKPARLSPRARRPDFFTAARGHHADIGGIAPGSMPAVSAHIDEEGALINIIRIVKKGRLLEADILSSLQNRFCAARRPDLNLADLKAQIAAVESGAALARQSAREGGGAPLFLRYMNFVRENAAQTARRLVAGARGGFFVCKMDDGAQIALRLKPMRGGRLLADFSGTSPVRGNNFNAPAAVVKSALMYCLRALSGEDAPLNEGLLSPVVLRIPKNCMLDPQYPAAVAAGNVETSQHIVDAALAAWGAAAAAQGTCNNFTFGFADGGSAQYYETICGGYGAGAGFDGASARQVHMTNSRLTDAEVLERNFAVRLEEFSIRKNSGGRGQWRGGDGVVRKLRFLRAAEANILSSRRRVAPHGLAGGKDGARGANRVIRASGKVEKLSGVARVMMQPGDVFEIKTPGGGGYGRL